MPDRYPAGMVGRGGRRAVRAGLRYALLAGLAAALLGACDADPPDRPAVQTPADGAAVSVRVQGNRFVDGAGTTVRLRGFNLSGGEYACIEGSGLFDTPDGAAPSDAVVRAMHGWRGANAVRVPLNEQCWLGLPAAPAAYAGEAYRAAVRTFVARLHRQGFVAILDLHRSAPGSAASKEQEQLPDRDHSPAFWTSLASTFAGDPGVVFDLFNEPAPYAEENTDRAWDCWRDGGCQLTSANSGKPYVAAGMNELITAVRATGARNVVLAGGILWAESLTRWLDHRPRDPLGQLGASFHAYSFNRYCAAVACYDRELTAVAAAVPLFTGEVGPNLTLGAAGIDDNCPRSAVRGTAFPDTVFDWLDAHGASYTPWSWNPWPDCWALIQQWNGNPTTGWGDQVRRRLASSS